MPPKNQQNTNVYDDSSKLGYIQPREHIRKRPGLYISGTNKRALHNMLWQVLGDAISEFENDKTGDITISLMPDKTATVSDNGKGFPIDKLEIGISQIEAYMTMIGFGGRNNVNEKVLHGGLREVSVFAINALSSFCEVEVLRDGYLWRQSYSEGLPTSPLEKIFPLSEDAETGTSIRFRPDFTIMEENDFDVEVIAKRCQELAFLLPNLRFIVQDWREGLMEMRYHSPNGMRDFVEDKAKGKTVLSEVFSIRHRARFQVRDSRYYEVQVEIAFQWLEGDESLLASFVNTVETPDGGYHLLGMKAGLRKALGIGWGKLHKGFVGVVHVIHPDPQFESQVKIRLLNTDVFQVVEEAVKAIFAANPEAKAAIQGRFKGE